MNSFAGIVRFDDDIFTEINVWFIENWKYMFEKGWLQTGTCLWKYAFSTVFRDIFSPILFFAPFALIVGGRI